MKRELRVTASPQGFSLKQGPQPAPPSFGKHKRLVMFGCVLSIVGSQKYPGSVTGQVLSTCHPKAAPEGPAQLSFSVLGVLCSSAVPPCSQTLPQACVPTGLQRLQGQRDPSGLALCSVSVAWPPAWCGAGAAWAHGVPSA